MKPNELTIKLSQVPRLVTDLTWLKCYSSALDYLLLD